MDCPNCRAVDNMFNSKIADHDLQEYRRRGPGATTRLLIQALTVLGIQGRSLIDIGGGVGAIQHELLKAGVAFVTGVDASSAYLRAARQETERQGTSQRVEYFHGNFVELASSLPQADIVTLEKVICCYPDMRALVEQSATRAGRFYGVVFPRDNWWMRLGGRVGNFFLSLSRNTFRFYVHPTREIEAILGAHQFTRRYYQHTFIWQVIVYERS